MKTDLNNITSIANCCNCQLAKTRYKVVIGKGHIPAKILFIGEGPGRSEDTMGIPFFGPSGRMLDKMLSSSWKTFTEMYNGANIEKLKKPVRSYGGTWTTKEFYPMPSMYITNIVLCRPCDENDENRTPFNYEVLACMQNVKEIISSVQPKIIIFVGKEAERYYRNEFPDGVRLTHPAALLRTGGVVSPFYNVNIRILHSIYERLYI